jgi:hypothetical protein
VARADLPPMALENSCPAVAHSECPHLILRRPAGRRSPEAVLCQCACHSDCPASVVESISVAEWGDICSCMGAADEIEIMHQSAERKLRVQEAVAAVGTISDRSASDLQADLLVEFKARGLDPKPHELELMARKLEADNGPPRLRKRRMTRGVGHVVGLIAKEARQGPTVED